MRSLPPPTFARDSVEALLAEHGTGGSRLYLLLILVVGAAVAALPLVEVPVTLRASGVLRPLVEKHEIRAAADGLVQEVLVRQNQRVRRGQPLVRTRPTGAAERAAALRLERESILELVHDLERLTGSAGELASDELRTGRYRLSLEHHQAALAQHGILVRHLERETARIAPLVDRGVLPRADLDDQAFELARERQAGAIIRRRALMEWEIELSELRARLSRVRAQEELLRAETAVAELTAPVDGTVEQLAALSPGSRVSGGDRVAVISPDTTVVAIAYAAARVAALLAPGDRARVEVEAYPPSEWGVASGRVTEIAADAVQVDGRLVFPFTIELDSAYLTLPNGRRGDLRKGMALQARFTLARRTIWALLREDISDWLEPARSGG